MTGPIDGPGKRKPKPKSRGIKKPKSEYADKPYPVGKGKPPVEHQFEHGNKGGGRRKGSKNRNHLVDLLEEKVIVGYDSLGRPRRRTWRNVIDLQLLKKASECDLTAVRIVKEFEYKVMVLKARYAPVQTQEDFTELLEKQRLSKILTERMVAWLVLEADLKKLSVLSYKDGKAFVPPWMGEAVCEYRERHRDDGPLPG